MAKVHVGKKTEAKELEQALTKSKENTTKIPAPLADWIKSEHFIFPINVDELPKHIKQAALGSGNFPYDKLLGKREYQAQLYELQIELVKMLDWIKRSGERLIILFEGRDGAGKGGTIQRLTKNLNPRAVRIIALPKPTPTEAQEWYFQRYVNYLPPKGEIAIFDRSWYNRASVERVFHFCTEEDTKHFLNEAPLFEAMLARDGIRIVKFFLTIGREMQIKRLHSRWNDPLRRWKLSKIDFQAIDHWDDYSTAYEQMLTATDSAPAPWTIVRANDKRRLRLEVIRHLLDVLAYEEKDVKSLGETDPRIVLSAASYLGTGGERE
jgi:polyphosphate kinase 2